MLILSKHWRRRIAVNDCEDVASNRAMASVRLVRLETESTIRRVSMVISDYFESVIQLLAVLNKPRFVSSDVMLTLMKSLCTNASYTVHQTRYSKRQHLDVKYVICCDG